MLTQLSPFNKITGKLSLKNVNFQVSFAIVSAFVYRNGCQMGQCWGQVGEKAEEIKKHKANAFKQNDVTITVVLCGDNNNLITKKINCTSSLLVKDEL